MGLFRFKYLILLIILLCAGPVRATDIEEIVTRAIEEHSFVVDPKAKFYHYYNLQKPDPRIENSDGRLAVASEHIKSNMSSFWNLGTINNGMMNAGPGLYAAVDPLASTDFGNIILEFRIKNGLKIVDLYKPFNLDFSKAEGDSDIIDALRMHPLVDSSILNVGLKGDFAGRKTKAMLMRIFKKLNIVGAEYSWPLANQFCKNSRRNAVVFFGRQPSTGGQEIDASDFDSKIMRSDFQNLTKEEESEIQSIERRKRFLDRLRVVQTQDQGPKALTIQDQYQLALVNTMTQTGFLDSDLKELKAETYKCN